MEKKNEKLKENLATGASTAMGAAVGVIAGSAVAQAASATENPETVEAEVVEEPTVVHVEHHDYHDAPAQSEQQTDVDNHLQAQPVGPEPIGEPQVRVLSDDVVLTEDGPSEVALVEVDGQPILVADMNMDGEANLMAADLNENGMLDEGEVIDVTDQHIQMAQFHDPAQAGMDQYLASNDGIDPDFVNDANVDDYLA